MFEVAWQGRGAGFTKFISRCESHTHDRHCAFIVRTTPWELYSQNSWLELVLHLYIHIYINNLHPAYRHLYKVFTCIIIYNLF